MTYHPHRFPSTPIQQEEHPPKVREGVHFTFVGLLALA